MFKFLRFWAPFRQPTFRPPRSLLRHNGQINVQHVRFVRPFFTRNRKHALIFASSIIVAFVYKVIDLTPDEKEEQGNAKLTVEKTEKGLVKIANNEKTKESDGWRQETSSEAAGREDLSQEESRSGTKDEYKDKDEAKVDDEAEDEYEDEAKNVNEEDGDDVDDDDDDDEEEDDEGEEGPLPEAIPEDALFIPLGFVRQRRSSYYKGTDPEWVSFVEFCRDRKRNELIRDELAGLVAQHTANMRTFQKALGMPIYIRKHWLDVDFPDRAPPEYERRGLEITGDYIALVTRPVSAREYYRLQTILWPTSMATSLWATYRLLISLRLARIKDYLNIKSEQENVNPNLSSSFFDFRRLANQKPETQPSPGVEGASPAVPGRVTPAESASKTSSKRAPSNSTNALPPMPSLPEPGEDMSIAMKTFRRTLAKTWKGPDIPAERGTFLISGLLQVEGSKAVCVLDIQALYHPRESRWVNIVVHVRRLQPRKQIPKGGS
ncbi:hypothetical protein MMC22_002034 [Lobaria immixta]|nr:hypothetical protein [Lobaria immixta]